MKFETDTALKQIQEERHYIKTLKKELKIIIRCKQKTQHNPEGKKKSRRLTQGWPQRAPLQIQINLKKIINQNKISRPWKKKRETTLHGK